MSRQQYDVCIIGSGPAGGVLAKELSESGARVVLIEAGRKMLASDFHSHKWPYQLPFRGAREGAQPAAAYEEDSAKAIRFVDSDLVSLDRIRAVGGRSLHWNANCFRFAEVDFKSRSVDGVEEDWPLSYSDLEPHYSYVERMIGVTGSKEGLEILPDGEFLPPLKLRCSEQILKRACAGMNIPLIPSRKAVLTVPYDNRPACHYCGHCMQGCDVSAIFSVATAMLPKAEKTGNFTLLPNKMARELLADRHGNIRSVAVIDTHSGDESEINARLFAVCCAVPESARLLLNSKSGRFPNGIANSNDMVGRYLHGSVFGGVSGYLEELAGTPPINNDGATDHACIPRFNFADKKRDYAGGFYFPLNYLGYMFPYHAKHIGGFGATFKNEVRTLQAGYVFMGAQGKILAVPENRITVDSHEKDRYGIPVPVVRFRFSDNDKRLWRDSVQKAHEILDMAKCRFRFDHSPKPEAFISHETGTVRMGRDSRTSVLNSYCQAHEVKNLFVVGGSSFTTYCEKNPTLTIMALAVRTARYMSDRVKRREL